MDDALAMRSIEGAGDLDGDSNRFVHRHRRRRAGSRACESAREACGERFALDVLHDEEIDGNVFGAGGTRGARSANRRRHRTFTADVVQHADVGVIE